VDKLLLRPAEAADLIGVGRSQVYLLIKRKEIPSVRLGSSIRVPARALLQWAEELTTRGEK
jgi:excisionase family DNA binding protein